MTSAMKGNGQVRTKRHQYLIPTLVFILGAVSIALLFWLSNISKNQRLRFQHIDAVMDIQVKTAVFHLWFEESVVGSSRDKIRDALLALEDAILLSHALMKGGVTEHGEPMAPLEDPRYRNHAQMIADQLAKMKDIASIRIKDPKAGGIGSALDEEFHRVFDKVMENARDFEVLAEKAYDSENVKKRRVIFFVLSIWIAVVVASGIWFYGIEKQRGKAERALERAHKDVEQKVLDRTNELSTVNRRLLDQMAEQRRTEEFLRKSETELSKLSLQFQTLLDTLPYHISLVSRDLKVLWANKSAYDWSSLLPGDSPDEYCYTFWHGISSPCSECPAVKSFQTSKPASAQIIGPDHRIWNLETVPVINAAGDMESVLHVANDVTEKLKLHAETMRTAHKASIGELSAGVAHEINNPVNGIINCAQILLDKSPEGSRENDLATLILKEGDRISTIVRGLLDFARENKEKKRPVAVEEILSDALALTRTQMKKESIELVTFLPSDLPEIVANSQQIQQVFMNVISNARYALNQKYIGANENKILEIRGALVTVYDTPYVRLSFYDHGIGISPQQMDKVMEPFFTNKPAGKGTGLGLSISHGIVSDHGGRLTINSVEGDFSQVIIDLPAKENDDGADPRSR